MLAVSPLRNISNGERGGEMESFPTVPGSYFSDFSCENFLDSIDFDDLFVGIDDDGGDSGLPDLEMDPEILAEFSSASGSEDYSAMPRKEEKSSRKDESTDKVSGLSSGSSLNQGEETVSKRDDNAVALKENLSSKDASKGRKSTSHSKNHHQGKRKVKVDWTPDLHRRFVQAVEQLGVDKAVPSRILELMGIDCLTRHNIASHLQKYRSHRKHLLAREAEAASWSQRRQMYGGGSKREMGSGPWFAPTMGFPPMAPPPPMHHPHFRPLHVWGHPPVDQSLMHVWPKHIAPSPSPPPPQPHAWAAPPSRRPPPPDPSFWHSNHQRVPSSVAPLTPYLIPPPPLKPSRFPTPPVPGIPPHAMYKVDPSFGGLPLPPPAGQTCPRPPFDFHPSKESIDAAIGDALSKPWQPLPLGLKSPSFDSVIGELQRQGVPKIPPTCG